MSRRRLVERLERGSIACIAACKVTRRFLLETNGPELCGSRPSDSTGRRPHEDHWTKTDVEVSHQIHEIVWAVTNRSVSDSLVAG